MEELMRVSNKIALVTGGSRGIGRAISELLAKEGATVISGDIKEPGTASPSGITDVRLDVTSESDWAKVVDKVVSEHGRVDILVNNAGYITYEPVHELSLDSWHSSIALMQTGVFLGMREVIPIMQKQKSGSIINFSSIWGNVAVPGAHAYHAAKGAVRIMTKNAALTYVGDGIRVNSVHPGITDTPLVASQPKEISEAVVGQVPMKRKGKPIEMAYGVLYLASDESSYTTGAELVIDGGATAT